MRRIFIALAILLALGNTAEAKNYITLESPAGNTIVDETGKWILGPYKDLHVNYIIDIGENYAYASFYDNGQKRYVNLKNMAYLPAGYDYELTYDYARALTNDGFKLVNPDGTYAINDVISAYFPMSDNLILGKKGEYWYLYNQKNGSQIIRNPIKDKWDSIIYLQSNEDGKKLFKIYTVDGYIQYITDDGTLLTETDAYHLMNSKSYEIVYQGAGSDNNEDSEHFFSRKTSIEYNRFSQVDKKNNTLFGMKTIENKVIIPAQYKTIEHMGEGFQYFIAEKENNKYGIIDMLNKTIVAFTYDSYKRLSDRSFVLKDSYGNHIFNASSGILFNEVYDSIDTSKPTYVLNKFTTATYDKTKYVIDTNTGYKLFKLPHFDDDITSFYKDLFVYKSNGKYGLMDYEGNIIIEPKFDKVTIDEPELAEYIKTIESYDK